MRKVSMDGSFVGLNARDESGKKGAEGGKELDGDVPKTNFH